jgi:hypothetical protein
MCTRFKAKQKLLIISTEVQSISLTYSQHFQLANKAIVMTREQPEREIKACQLGFATKVLVHEQSTNNMVYIMFQ